MLLPQPPGHHRSSSPKPPRISSAIAFDRSNARSSAAVCTCRYRLRPRSGRAGSRSTSASCTEPSVKLASPRRPIDAPTRSDDRSSTPDGPAPRTRAVGYQGRSRGSHATHRRRPCDPTATARTAAGRKSAFSDARSFATLRRHFSCTARIIALLRYRPIEWRRRESNPRPRPYRPNVYERSPRFGLARRPVRGRPTGGPALLKCRASGEWLSLGA